jgi:hypothetical protein
MCCNFTHKTRKSELKLRHCSEEPLGLINFKSFTEESNEVGRQVVKSME